MRLLLVQYAGDYREAYQRLTAGGVETYYGQRQSVEYAGVLAQEYGAYGVLCLTSTCHYDEQMPNGVRAAGIKFTGIKEIATDTFRYIESFKPTHLVVTTPQAGIIGPAVTAGLDVLPLFADTFQLTHEGGHMGWLRSWKHRLNCKRLGRMLADRRVRWVGNHNVNACRQLVGLGVDAGKVVPWDWTPEVRPMDYPVKSLTPGVRDFVVVFVGAITPSKGVGDVVAAVAELRRRGVDVRARVIGQGKLKPFIQQAEEAGAAAAIEFAGPLPHADVLAAMRDADLVLVPSWHSYPEGLPLTIYEALATRTPLICSDHPAFRDRIGDGVSAESVPERSPLALADAVVRVVSDPDRYRRMSESTAGTWANLVCPVSYYELIRRWVRGEPADDTWLAAHSLDSGRYDRTAEGQLTLRRHRFSSE